MQKADGDTSEERKTVQIGCWIPKFNGKHKGGAYWFDCDKCGRTVPGGLTGGYYFCPNCGDRKKR